MDRIPVSSSNIASICYDEATSTLEVEFLSGRIYHYYGIPQYMYEAFINADSKGKYLNEYIKKAGYSYAQVG
ncbi:MAG: KTSC domain-containing protein [SAR324 cluster bacterium]|uniref:KTSC domain-containing protein n=1 Tax=SAR324 cluster bacterium TaxID=2024889 RepID=A0A7X9ILC7_9DELT|nr:KTSC domain-containing protein [SAR324 cluster bacterium]